MAVALVGIGVTRIVATYSALSETVDEVAHVGAGLEWLGRGRYTFELQHPPLARVAAALGPYLRGVRSQGQTNMWDEGRRALYAGAGYERNLTAARLAMLPFFMLAAFFVWRIGEVAFGTGTALGAVACFTLLPPVLAHFGVATTDAPMLAVFAASLYALMRWLDEPNVARALGLGVAAGVGLVTKFSFVPYFAVAAVALFVARYLWGRRRARASKPSESIGETVPSTAPWSWGDGLPTLAVAAAGGLIVAWAAYRFSFGDWRGVPLPLAQVPLGILEIAEHNQLGHPAYFLGQSRALGVWYFFPVILVLKTPIAALTLGVLGFLVLSRAAFAARDWHYLIPVTIAIVVLGVAIPARINIGVRHVLPFYVGLALAAGYAWVWLWARVRRSIARTLLVAVTLLLSIDTVTAHPDYLAYFNGFAGRDPSRLVADSDLDWGQDLFRLRRAVKERGVDTLRFAYINNGDLAPIVGVPVEFWDGTGRPSGWVAVSETWYRRGEISHRGGAYIIRARAYAWLDSAATFTRVGKGIRLYRLPSESPKQ
jgi:hypothetical protein